MAKRQVTDKITGAQLTSNSAAWLLLRRWCFFAISSFLFIGYAYLVVLQLVIHSTRPPMFDFRASSTAAEPRQIGELHHVFCGQTYSIGWVSRRRPAHLQGTAPDWLAQTFLRVHIFSILDAAVWRKPICASVELYYNYCAHSAVYVHRSEWQRERA